MKLLLCSNLKTYYLMQSGIFFVPDYFVETNLIKK